MRQWAWQQAVPPKEMVVLLAYAEEANDDGVCHLTTQELHARRLALPSMSTRSLERFRTSLVGRGLLQLVRGQASCAWRLAAPPSRQTALRLPRQTEGRSPSGQGISRGRVMQ
ncbi:MAG: hypothetical protein KC620_26315 [Myxococcales bacterium]|nr:hypothetical protein [Myxococcales bacterium]